MTWGVATHGLKDWIYGRMGYRRKVNLQLDDATNDGVSHPNIYTIEGNPTG